MASKTKAGYHFLYFECSRYNCLQTFDIQCCRLQLICLMWE